MNATLHDYLDALGTWLAESGGYDKNRDKVQPGNGWEVMNDALRAATQYK